MTTHRTDTTATLSRITSEYRPGSSAVPLAHALRRVLDQCGSGVVDVSAATVQAVISTALIPLRSSWAQPVVKRIQIAYPADTDTWRLAEAVRVILHICASARQSDRSARVSTADLLEAMGGALRPLSTAGKH